jgi:FKBP-type peptidyl-prolyl cis-trans isomerase 2
MNVNTIIAGLHTMSEDDVRKINQAAYDILNGQRKQRIAAKKRELYVGMEVQFQGKTGTIIKVNRTKCVVEVPGGPFGSQRWNVPMTMLTPTV